MELVLGVAILIALLSLFCLGMTALVLCLMLSIYTVFYVFSRIYFIVKFVKVNGLEGIKELKWTQRISLVLFVLLPPFLEGMFAWGFLESL